MKPIILVTALALASSPAFAEEDGATLLKVATVAPQGTPWSALMDRFKARTLEKLKGTELPPLKVKIYYGGKLGGEKESLRETREGRVQMWGGSAAAVATMVPEIYALEAPFLFESSEEADHVLDKHARSHVAKLLAEQGLVLYQFAENGWHGIATRDRCITGTESLKGLRIRSQEAQVHVDTLKALGASPVEMAVPEVLQSLQTGVVDGFSNTPLFSFASSWYQGIKFYTVTDHVYQPAIILYSKKWFDKQPKAMQEILLLDVDADQKFGRDGVRLIKDGLLENFKKANKQICTMSAAQRDELRKASAKVYPELKKKYAKKGKPLFDAIDAGKKAFAGQKK